MTDPRIEQFTKSELVKPTQRVWSSFIALLWFKHQKKLVAAPDLCLKMSKCKLLSYLKKVWCSTQHFQRFLHDALLGASKKNDVSLHCKKKKERKKSLLENITIQN